MKDKDGNELREGDFVIYVAKDQNGFGSLFEGKVIAVKPDYAVVEHGTGAYVCKYPQRIALLGDDDEPNDN